jgi:predicted phosphodiesterase
MAKFRILWVDDEWDIEPKNEIILKTKNEIINKLTSEEIDIAIKTEKNIPEALVEVEKTDIEYRLVIVDLHFNNQRYQVEPLFTRLTENKIPYIIFTNFIDSIGKITVNNDKYQLVIGRFKKDSEGSYQLLKTVVLFFKSVPVRILHLSDLHFHSTLSDSNEIEERDALFDSLLTTIEEENKRQRFDLVAICGDISMNSPENDLLDSRSLIKKINKLSVNSYERFAIVPGNHDIQWRDFHKKELARHPLKSYLEFYRAIYDHKLNILNEMGAWNSQQNLFIMESTCDRMSWVRRLPSSGLSIIGLATPSLVPDQQGNGHFLREHQQFIRSHWADNNTNLEIRLALMHHNIYASLSYNRKGETRVLENSGEAMYTLMSSGCTCVLSGHTHSVNYIRCAASRMGLNGFSALSSFDVITGGTTGGMHKSGDRPRSFNIIHFSHCNINDMKRSISVSPFLYDSDEHKWTEKGLLIV